VTRHRRYYKAGVKEALFMLSRGRCYAPKCPQRVLRMVDDDPSVNIEVAHIHGLNTGSARFDERISLAVRNSFGNLLLLCQAHHGPVDDPAKQHKYTVKLLKKWKTAREGDFEGQLAGLDVLSREDVEAMLVSAVTDTKNEILHAIDVVATISKDTADTLRALVKESFDRPYLDLDAVAMLADSAISLRHLPDTAGTLASAAGQLANLEGTARILLQAAEKWDDPPVDAYALREAATELNTALGQAHSATWGPQDSHIEAIENASFYLTNIVTRIERAAEASAASAEVIDNADHGVIIQQIDDGRHWLYFRWGLGLGAGLVAAIAIFIAVYINKGT
jgi:hypothetical protein